MATHPSILAWKILCTVEPGRLQSMKRLTKSQTQLSDWACTHHSTCCSVTQSCLTVCDPMDCSTPSLPVPHHLLKFAQVHVHCIGDAIQPFYPDAFFSFSPQSFPASGTFPVSWLFASDDETTGGMSYKYWLYLSGIMCHLKLVFLY